MGKLLDLNGKEVTVEQIDIDGFKFNKAEWSSNTAMAFMLLITADPTEKQKEILKQMELTVLDDTGKKFFPREEVKLDKNN